MLDFGLWYSKGKYFTLTSYTDAYLVCSVDDRKSTNGDAFFLGNNSVPCLRKKQALISISTAKA